MTGNSEASREVDTSSVICDANATFPSRGRQGEETYSTNGRHFAWRRAGACEVFAAGGNGTKRTLRGRRGEGEGENLKSSSTAPWLPPGGKLSPKVADEGAESTSSQVCHSEAQRDRLRPQTRASVGPPFGRLLGRCKNPTTPMSDLSRGECRRRVF